MRIAPIAMMLLLIPGVTRAEPAIKKWILYDSPGSPAIDYYWDVSYNRDAITPTLDNGNCYWTDLEDAAGFDIWGRTLPGGGYQHPVIERPGYQAMPHVDGDILVYLDSDAGREDLWWYNVTTEEHFMISSNSHSAWVGAQVSGSNVVYAHNDGTGSAVYWYDHTTGTSTQLTDTANIDFSPAVDGILAAWSASFPGTSRDIVITELGSGTNVVIAATEANERAPSVSGDRVAYLVGNDVAYYDRGSGQTVRLTEDARTQSRVVISGDYIYFTDHLNGHNQVWVHPIGTVMAYQLTEEDGWDRDVWDADGLAAVFEYYASVHRVSWIPDLIPIAEPGPDQILAVGETASLDGSASCDVYGAAVPDYEWTITSAPAGSTAALDDPLSATPSFTPDLNGDYVVSLRVFADGKWSDPDTTVVTAMGLIVSWYAAGEADIVMVETRLTSDPADQLDASVTGSNVVYTDRRNGSDDLWRVILGEPPAPLEQGAGDQANPHCDGRAVVYTDDASGQQDVWRYNWHYDRYTRVSSNTLADAAPATSGQQVVYEGPGTGGPEIYWFGDDTGETLQLTANTWPDTAPAIHGDLAAWVAYPASTPDIMATVLGSGSNFTVAATGAEEVSPSVSGDLIAYVTDSDLAFYDRLSGHTVPVTRDPQVQKDAVVTGDTIFFTDNRTGSDQIWAHPIGSTRAFQLTTNAVSPTLTDAEGESVVFHDLRHGSPDVFLLKWRWAEDQAPVADAGTDQSVLPGTTAQLDGSASADPDGHAVTHYLWSVASAPSGSVAQLSDPAAGNPTFTPDLRGRYEISLTVRAGGRWSEPDTVVVAASGIISNWVFLGDDPGLQIDEKRLTDSPGTQFDAAVSRYNTVFSDLDPGSLDIYRIVLDGDPWPLIEGPGNQNEPDIDGTTIVYTDDAGGMQDVWWYDWLTDDHFKITTNPYQDLSPAISGNNVVWDGYVDFNNDIYWFNFDTSDVYPLTQTPEPESSPAVDGNLAAWMMFSYDSGTFDVLGTVLGGDHFVVADTDADELRPSISGNRIAYLIGYDAAYYDHLSGQTVRLTEDPHAQHTIKISGDYIYFTDNRTGSDQLWVHVLGTDTALQLTSNAVYMVFTDADDDIAVFHDQRYGNLEIFRLQWGYDQPPIADAGEDQAVLVGESAQLSAGGSHDPDGQACSQALWTIETAPSGSLAELSNVQDWSPSFIPDLPGDYLLSLVVQAGGVWSGPDYVTVTANTPPVADAGADLPAALHETLQLEDTGSWDPDGHALVVWQWTLESKPPLSDTAVINAHRATPTLTPDQTGDYVLAMSVSDGMHWSAPDTVTVAVNTRPVADLGPDQALAALDETFILDGSNSWDPDGDPITGYAWSMVHQPSNSTPELRHRYSSNCGFSTDLAAVYQLSLEVFDGTHWSLPAPLTVTVNTRPVADAGPDVLGLRGGGALLESRDSWDPDGDPIVGYDWALDSVPPGSTSVLSDVQSPSTIVSFDQSGTYVVSLAVDDGYHWSHRDTVTLVANQVPVADAGPDQASLYVGQEVTLDGTGSWDPDADPLTRYSWGRHSVPPGSTAQLSDYEVAQPDFVPDQVGVFILSLRVHDGLHWSVPNVVELEVDNIRPVADAGPDQYGLIVDEAAQLDASGSWDPDSGLITAHSWDAVSGPTGSSALGWGSPSPTPTFTPDREGDYVLSLRVYDGRDWSPPDMVQLSTEEEAPMEVSDVEVTVTSTGILVNVQWLAESGVVYQVQGSSNLWQNGSNAWHDLGAPITGPVDSVVLPDQDTDEGYYRVRGGW